MISVMLACLLPLLVYAYHGVHAVPRVLIWSAECMGTPPARIFYAIELPASLAAILTGLRIALGFSFVLAISAEMIAAKSGIGRLKVEYGENGAYDYMFAAVSAIVIVAFAADRGLIALTTHALRWAGATPRGGSRLMRARATALARQIAQLYPLLFVIIIWQVAANFGWVRPIFLPSFSSVVLKAGALAGNGELWPPLFVSLYRAGAGLALAVVIGIPVGFVMARWRPVWCALDPLVAFAYPAPKLAFVPIFILWFGIDHLAKILLVAFSCTFPIIISAYSGALTVSVRQIWAAQAMGTPPLTLFGRVILPAALPSLMSGLRISIPLALLTAFTAEMVSGGGGLGGGLVLAQRYFESDTVFVYILIMLVSGYVIDSLFLMARHWILRWDESEAASAG